MSANEMFRPKQSVDRVGCSARTLYRWVKEGHIKKYRRGGCTFFNAQEVAKFIMGLEDQPGD